MLGDPWINIFFVLSITTFPYAVGWPVEGLGILDRF